MKFEAEKRKKEKKSQMTKKPNFNRIMKPTIAYYANSAQEAITCKVFGTLEERIHMVGFYNNILKDMLDLTNLLNKSKFKEAAKLVRTFDTADREVVPDKVWKYIGNHYVRCR